MTAPAKAHGNVRRTTSTASTAATGAQEHHTQACLSGTIRSATATLETGRPSARSQPGPRPTNPWSPAWLNQSSPLRTGRRPLGESDPDPRRLPLEVRDTLTALSSRTLNLWTEIVGHAHPRGDARSEER